MLLGGSGEKVNRGGGSRVKLDVNKGMLSGLKYKLVCHFKLVTDMVRGGVREYGIFLKRELVGLRMDRYQ